MAFFHFLSFRFCFVSNNNLISNSVFIPIPPTQKDLTNKKLTTTIKEALEKSVEFK